MPFPAVPDEPPKGPGNNGPNNRTPWSGPKPPAVNPGDAKINPNPYIQSPTGSGTYVPKYPNLGEMPPDSQWVNRTNSYVPDAQKLRDTNPVKPPATPPGGAAPGIGATVFNAAAKLSNIALGIQLGEFASGFFSPSNILSNEAEKLAIQKEKQKRKNPIVDITPPGYSTPPVAEFQTNNLTTGVVYRVVWDGVNWFGQPLASSFWGGALFFDISGPFEIVKTPIGTAGQKSVRARTSNGNFTSLSSRGDSRELPSGQTGADAMIDFMTGSFQITRIIQLSTGADVQKVTAPPDIPPVTNITNNNQTINNNTTTITNVFPAAPSGFPAASPPPAALPTPKSPTDTPESDRPPTIDNTPVGRPTPVLIPFGVPVGTGADADSIRTNTRVNDPVKDAANRVNPNTFNPVRSNADATVTNSATINPPSATPPNIQPPTNTPPINNTTKQNQQTNQIPPIFVPIPAVDPSKSQPLQTPTPATPVNQTPAGNSCCVPTPIAQQLNRLENKANPTDLIDWSILGIINNKLGPQVNGGISGFLKRIDASRMVDRALNIMGTAASLHNAAMLSRNIGETLGQTVSNLLGIVGIKDADDQVSTFTEAISQSITNTIKGAIGESNYTALSETWATANRIYQSAINAYQLMTDSLSGLASGLEQTAKYTGKIGNALRKSGAVLENSYQWMSEAFSFRTGKLGAIDRVIRGLDQAQEVASDLESITGEFRNVTENINQIGTEINTIRTEIQGKETEKETTETSGKTNSQSPTINKSNLNKPEG